MFNPRLVSPALAEMYTRKLQANITLGENTFKKERKWNETKHAWHAGAHDYLWDLTASGSYQKRLGKTTRLKTKGLRLCPAAYDLKSHELKLGIPPWQNSSRSLSCLSFRVPEEWWRQGAWTGSAPWCATRWNKKNSAAFQDILSPNTLLYRHSAN